MKMRHAADVSVLSRVVAYEQFERPLGGRFGVTIGTRRTAILDSACEVFARRGYQVAPMRDVARASHLSLAGVYHSVGSKDELRLLVLDRARYPARRSDSTSGDAQRSARSGARS